MYRNQSRSKHKQSGNVYIIAIFVIVVMGMLTLNLTRISWSNQDTLTREVLGTQARFLAKSGNEWALTHLFPLNEGDDSTLLSTRCTSMSSFSSNAAKALSDGLSCDVPTIKCIESTKTQPDLSYFSVSTIAVCGRGNDYEVEREETVWVRGIKDE